MAPAQRFVGYPKAREGPKTPYIHPEDSNPVMRGWTLVFASTLVTHSSVVAKAVWTNAQFGTIKDIPGLGEYTSRLQPVVTPLGSGDDTLSKPSITPDLVQRQPDELAGRFHSAADYHELYKSGKLTPVQVAEALLPLISQDQESGAKYGAAWATVNEEIALEAAKASAKRYAAGKPLSVLDGVPFAVKDDLNVKGYTSHVGLQRQEGIPFFDEAKETIWPVAQLEAAGGLMIGKVTMHELGSDTSGCNPRRGKSPINWYNTSYYTGGSSSGGGSALSSGLVPIAIGTDAGGSIRIPSSFCGMYGLKPTLHRIWTMNSAICVAGPKAATVADLTLAYRLMAAPNPDDPVQGAFAPSIPPSPTEKRTIGIYSDWFNEASPAVREVTNKAIDYFKEKLGYEVIEIHIPYIREGQLAHSAWALSELNDHHRHRHPDPHKALSLVNHANAILMTMGSETSAVDMLKYGQLRELIMEHLAFLWQKYPDMLIVTPTAPDAGWKIHPGDQAYGFSDGNTTIRQMMYIWLANSTGCPALSAPVGYIDPEQGEGQLPVGLMAMGEWGAEELLLSWAKDSETYLNDVWDTGRVRPKEWADVVKLATE
ncbi:Fatty acid amide hydrolase [Apiospora hydei]|uniref:Fatty acid amide hydrolase n=1 Tax=Apiospora hydei TaxID=1337664 RepID=A0ABR1X1R9_9PEZI